MTGIGLHYLKLRAIALALRVLTLASWITYSRLWPKCDGHVDRGRFRTLRETPIRIRVAILSDFGLD